MKTYTHAQPGGSVFSNAAQESEMSEQFPIVYTTERPDIILRQLTVADAPDYFAGVDEDRSHLSRFGDDTASRYLRLEDVVSSLNHPQNLSGPQRLRLGIWNGDMFVGSINLQQEPFGEQDTVEIGYWLRASAVGKGYATTAVRALAAMCPRYLRLMARTDPANTASRNVLTRSGFIPVSSHDTAQQRFELPHESARIVQEPVLYSQILEDSPGRSVARVALRGQDTARINELSTMTYVVEYGEGTITTENSMIRLVPNACVAISPEVPYQIEGDIVMRAIGEPPFDPKQVTLLKGDLAAK